MDKIGKFEIIEVIGEGGMGVVYRALDPLIEREVAIKVITERAMTMPEIKRRFYREASSAGKLSHENITVVHEVGEIDGNPYIVMEYLDGEDLSQIIKERKPIALQDKIKYAIQICRGLQYAHSKKIVHRDIKPDNIIVLPDGKVKIMDFGIAKPEASTLTQTGIMVGTLSYMSPEQIKGIKVDNRSDIFSFGVLFYELLTYKRPFEGDSTTVMYKIVHEEPEKIQIDEHELVNPLQEILSKCLRKNPDERYSTCSELAEELEEVISLKGIRTTIEQLLEQGKTLCKEHSAEAISRFEEVLKIDPDNKEAQNLKQQCLEDIDAVDTVLAPKEKKKPADRVVKPQTADPPKGRKGLYAFSALFLMIALGVFAFQNEILSLFQQDSAENSASVAEPERAENVRLAETNNNENTPLETSNSEAEPDLTAFKDAATDALDKALAAQKSADKAKNVDSYEKAVAALSEGRKELDNQNYEVAQTKFASATSLFGDAIIEARDLRMKNAKLAEQISETENAEQDAVDARSEADRLDASEMAREAYRYATDKLSEAQQLVRKKKYSEAVQRYGEAKTGFSTAINERQVIERSQKMFQKGDYEKCMKELETILQNKPYKGENRNAKALFSEVQRAQFNRSQKITDAKNALKKGLLSVALASLQTLPERDQSYFEIRDLRKKIISQDKSPPTIQHSEEKTYPPEEPIDITAMARDDLEIKRVLLYYVKKGTDTFSEAEMKPKEQDVYSFMIPQEYHKGKEIKYYFVAIDANGNRQNLKDRKKPYKIKSKSKGTNIPQIP